MEWGALNSEKIAETRVWRNTWGRKGVCEKGKNITDKIGNAMQVKEIKKGDRNACRILAKRNHSQFFINEKLSLEFTDKLEKKQLRQGFNGLQLHDKRVVVDYKDFFLKN